ncbi:MAG: hypothetical protein IT385_18370, partial [Deltaproteobacteria bacterium]|nr:hypothetical protein [Deltaproteobacteria bacterium]
GCAVFQALTRGGERGLFLTRGDEVRTLFLHPDLDVTSHPARSPAGITSAYATDAGGGDRLLRLGTDEDDLFANTADLCLRIGPLGPTTNARGDVAFRATTHERREAVCLAGHDLVVVADTRAPARGATAFARFEGLPLVDERGRVSFRADLPDGRHGIWRRDGDRLDALVETGPASGLSSLGRFPCLDGADAVVCTGVHASGWSGIFRFSPPAAPEVLARSGGAFESFRGALAAPDQLVFYATPPGGSLGVYRSQRAAPAPVRLVGLGDPLAGSTVVDLARNPVSIDVGGAVAMRLALASGQQLIAVA